ncbi:MAG: histidinol-phosphate transaminase [Rhodobacteraceae bacterium]|nr:histidinol-phosphate transaminase [Paracoccaceae bacterium]
MTDTPQPQPGILDIALYQGGASHADGVERVIKLSSNENPFGTSDAAKAALIATASTLHRYPSTDHAGLRNAIGEVHGLDPETIICGVGSDEILCFLCQAYAGVGDEVIYTEHGFSMYRIYALGAGATPVQVPEAERVVDVAAILTAVTPKTRLVFLANPANPTGTMIGQEALVRLADGLPGHVILVLDGAYAEFPENYDGGASLIATRGNVVMTRTFSKLYGLGGLRVGWGHGPKAIIDVLNRMRGPFNLSSVQLATAEAALRDRAFAERCLAENTRLRRWLIDALGRVGVPCDESHANFVLARFASPDEADATEARLRADGILVRKVAGYNLPQCLRITVGDEASCRRVVSVIGAFREAAA